MSSQQRLVKKNVVHYTSNRLNISAGQEIRMPVVVNESESSKLQYTFTTTSHSIGFAVNFFRDDGRKLVLITPKQFNSHQTPIQGEVAVEGRGVLSVIWDNGYSWSDQNLSSHIKIEYARPLPDDTVVDSKHAPAADAVADTKAVTPRTSQPPAAVVSAPPEPTDTSTPPAATPIAPLTAVPTAALTAKPSTPSTPEVDRTRMTTTTATISTTTTSTASATAACKDPQNAQLEAKCKYLFTQFDRDKDGYLNCAEMNKFTQTVNISHQKIDDAGWIKLCRYWSLNPMRGMDYNTLLKVYRAVPGSIDSDMRQFFRRNPALRSQANTRADFSSHVPDGYVEVVREDGSTYWTDPGMTHVIEGRPAPVVKTATAAASASSVTEAKSTHASPLRASPPRRTPLSARDMIRHIFLYFDRDGDGFLNHLEMQRFSRVINNSTRPLTRQDWLQICQYWGATHKGLTAEHLRRIYESDSGASLTNDFAAVQSLEREQQRIKAQSAPAATATGTPVTATAAAAAAAATAKVQSQDDAALAKENATIEQMTREIFEFFDEDQDGFLNKAEMMALSKETEEEGVRINDDKWEQTCKVMGVEPAVGLAMSDLLRVYHRDVDKDYLQVFGNQRFAVAIDHAFTSKAKAIFDHHDQDGDGFLNRNEMNAFTLATEDDQEALDEAQWKQVCGDMAIDPSEGIALTHLIQIYKQVLQDDYQVLCALRGSDHA